jgi:hypothetical protein
MIATWMERVLRTDDPEQCWQAISDDIIDLARTKPSPEQLHDALIPLDRLLADAAWPLWEAFPAHAPRTIAALETWWQTRGHDRAVLILDGLSLREVPLLLAGLDRQGITPQTVRATGAEVPTDTDHFAKALGLPGRSALSNDHAPKGFALASDDRFTDVLSLPFGDCVADLPPRRDLILWHEWPDDFMHSMRDVDALHSTIATGLNDEGFWRLVGQLRQGRELVITSDHGYATTDRFTTMEEGAVKDYLVGIFKAQRMARAAVPLRTAFLPPPALTFGDYHVVIGQRSWKVPSGFPPLCHGGLSLLEAFSPFVIIPEAA